MFIIEPESGLVEVAGALDFESKALYNITISVTDGVNTALTMVSKTLILNFSTDWRHRLRLAQRAWIYF